MATNASPSNVDFFSGESSGEWAGMEEVLGRVVSFGKVKEERGTHWAKRRSCPQAEAYLGDHADPM